MTNENRLIYANEAYEIARASGRHSDFARSRADLTSLEEVLEECTTVDAVEVVRCKDCTNFERKFPGYGYCYHWDYEPGMSPNEVEDDDFCSYGERKHNG